MNKNELLTACTWTDDVINECSVRLSVPIFKTTVEFEIYSDITKQGDLSDTVVATINDILALNENSLGLIKQHLWEDCKFICSVAEFGDKPKNDETQYEANLRSFDIYDCEAAYKKSRLVGVYIEEAEEYDVFTHRYAILNFEGYWGGNVIDLIIQDGQLIARYENGAYLGWYEAGEKYDPKTSDSPLLSRNIPVDSCSSLRAAKLF